jgi:hypothetical protein
MKYNASRAYAPTSELAIMTIMINNDNNGQLLVLFTIIHGHQPAPLNVLSSILATTFK